MADKPALTTEAIESQFALELPARDMLSSPLIEVSRVGVAVCANVISGQPSTNNCPINQQR